MDKQIIKLVRLLSDKKNREQYKLFVAEGVKLCSEVVKSNLKIYKLFYINFLPEELNGVNSEKISVSEMSRISALKNPPTALALVEIPDKYDISIEQKELVLALDCVQDPGNLGTIIRICDWFGIRKIFCSFDCADLYNNKVVQSTMGAITRVEVEYCDLESKLLAAKQSGIPIYSTALDGDNIYKSELSKSGVIVMGNEGKGVSEKIQKLSTSRLLIPSYPEDNVCESLNVAVATSIICSEFRR
ncbi:MAG: RNA methyltransferase [Rikenellaceae bacterium]